MVCPSILGEHSWLCCVSPSDIRLSSKTCNLGGKFEFSSSGVPAKSQFPNWTVGKNGNELKYEIDLTFLVMTRNVRSISYLSSFPFLPTVQFGNWDLAGTPEDENSNLPPKLQVLELSRMSEGDTQQSHECSPSILGQTINLCSGTKRKRTNAVLPER